MKLCVLGMQAHRIGIVFERQIDPSGPSMEGTSIAVRIEVIGLQIDRLLKAMVGFLDAAEIAQGIAQVVQRDRERRLESKGSLIGFHRIGIIALVMERNA